MREEFQVELNRLRGAGVQAIVSELVPTCKVEIHRGMWYQFFSVKNGIVFHVSTDQIGSVRPRIIGALTEMRDSLDADIKLLETL